MARKLLRDDQYKRIAGMLLTQPGDPGRKSDNRLFLEAVLWIARSGTPWRGLPPEFGEWNTVYQRFGRWSKKGVWHKIFAELAKDADFSVLSTSISTSIATSSSASFFASNIFAVSPPVTTSSPNAFHRSSPSSRLSCGWHNCQRTLAGGSDRNFSRKYRCFVVSPLRP